MNVTAEGAAQPAPQAVTEDSHGHHVQGSLAKLMLGAAGVVFGDIGTSPIYAFRETFAGHHTLEPDQLHIFGVLSLIFWSMMIIVTLKYVTIIMRADNKGEGGSLALLALINRSTGTTRRWTGGIVMLGVFATALFYGDSMITPAISVLSAVEGLKTVNGAFEPYVIPLCIGILVGLFMIQSRGTAKVGNLFGPVMIVYFVTLAVLGTTHLVAAPGLLLEMLNPLNALYFYYQEPLPAFIAMGSVVLAVTGAEALYADMGHFGKRPIRYAWIFVIVALLLNYLGQGAMLLQQSPEQARELVKNPFFFLAPESLRLPLVLLATCATVIASQAVITGAFSVTQQAIQLGFIPRLRILQTSESAKGQIYIPVVNWALMVAVVLLVVSFGSSSNLAAAYGIAVTGAMFIDTLLLAVVFFSLWKWPAWKAVPLLALFLLVDILYFGANLLKVPDGGWVPLVVGVIGFTLLTTWAKGRKLMLDRMAEASLPMEVFVKSAANSATRVPGTAVFMTSSAKGVPHALLHNLKHNKVLHERVMLLTVRIEDVPYVREERRLETEDYTNGFFRVVLRYGFMEELDVPTQLGKLQDCGPVCRMMDTSFFLARQTLISTARPGMASWRERLFAWMLRNSESAMEFFKLPPNRVVELGSQVEI
ncbi:KUP system potassium uptake protein [Sphingomonas kaistensis]|uniref:Probable potassium transport system protein Kup n=1 Tax=Sphingomonas kaistensis TaxID=298708 RepID=A0A7X5Y6V5_9SPHN|nr:potassium transporter Kup [Sphingomonas kaistensis]NJC06298.1 KUP system potassium uptake protein [Sphingomonas kaistensis]